MADDRVPLPPGFEGPEQAQQPQAEPSDAPIESTTPELQGDTLPPGFQWESDYYGSPKQQATAFLEGTANAVVPGAATALEKATNTYDEEDVQHRANSVAHAIGTMTGLAGGIVTGEGLPGLMEQLGTGAKAAAGLTGIGGAAVKGAVENAVFQAGDEFSKMAYHDPDSTAQSAAANIGLSGLIGGGVGGAFGAVSPLWEAAKGSKLAQLLGVVQKKAAGDAISSDATQAAMSKLGVDVPAEVKAALSDDPTMHEAFSTLAQSDTTSSGKALQQTLKDFNQKVSNRVAETLGHTADTIPGDVSKYEYGKALGNTLADEFEQQVKPLSDKFDQLKQAYAGVPLTPEVKNSIAEGVAQLANKERWTVSPESDIMKKINQVFRELPNLQRLDDLGAYTSNMEYDMSNGPLRRAMGLVKGVFRDAESNSALQHLGSEAPELVDSYKAARNGWKEASDLKDALDDRLHTRSNAGNFSSNLREMAQTDGEKVLSRLSGSGDANLLDLLNNRFPKTSQALRGYHLDSAMSEAAAKAAPGEPINVSKLAGRISKMSPELRNFVVPEEAQQTLNAAGVLNKKIGSIPYNHSNTARTIEKLMHKIPGNSMGMTLGVLGHHPIIGYLTGHLSTLLSKDAPDAIKLALLKAVGNSDVDANPTAFKAMVDYLDAAAKGQRVLSSGVKAIFKAAPTEGIRAYDNLSTNQAKKLDQQVQAYNTQPNSLDNAYLPDHAMSASNVASTAVNYLAQQRPQSTQSSPLDRPMEPTPQQKQAYLRTLTNAEKPLNVLSKIKDGTLSPQDVKDVASMYPKLYAQMKQKLTDGMLENQAKGRPIPYQTKAAMSLFLGTPLDSTFSPQSMHAIQIAQSTPTSQQQSAAAPKQKRGTAPLKNFADVYSTPLQSREAAKSKLS
jgi:hypothetical protein